MPRYNYGMKVVYIDSLFVTNLAIDYLLLLASAQVCGVRLKRARYLAAAVLGSVYAVCVYLPRASFLLVPCVKLCAGLIMALVAFGGEARRIRCALVFFSVSAAFGGFIWAIELAGGHPAFDTRTLIVSFALCYALLSAVFRGRAQLADRPRVAVELVLNGRTSHFNALVDTGNTLKDPITGAPVMVICPHAAAPLFSDDTALLQLDAVSFAERAAELTELRGRVRLIPYTVVGGGGVLAAFRPDSVIIDGSPRDILTALSANAQGDGYEGIV